MGEEKIKIRSDGLEMAALRIVHRERGEATGRTVRDELEKVEKRPFALTTAYTVLERLEQKGLIETRLTNPLPERGGRRKQLFSITGAGVTVLTQTPSATELPAQPVLIPEKQGVR